MKTKEELRAIREEVETLNKKLAELTPEELERVMGGSLFFATPCRAMKVSGGDKPKPEPPRPSGVDVVLH